MESVWFPEDLRLSEVLVCAAMAMQNLGSPMQLGFPISNYTMSLALLERVDFWDTSEDAIGEDFHMFVKAYFKTHGQVRSSSYQRCPSRPRRRAEVGAEDSAYLCPTIFRCFRYLEVGSLPGTAPCASEA